MSSRIASTRSCSCCWGRRAWRRGGTSTGSRRWLEPSVSETSAERGGTGAGPGGSPIKGEGSEPFSKQSRWRSYPKGSTGPDVFPLCQRDLWDWDDVTCIDLGMLAIPQFISSWPRPSGRAARFDVCFASVRPIGFFGDFSGPICQRALKLHKQDQLIGKHVMMYGSGVCAQWVTQL